MKTKLLKFLITISIVLMFVFSASSDVIAKITQTVRGTEQNFGITLLHQSPLLDGSQNVNFAYRLDTRNAYRVYSGTSSNKDFETTIICLNKDGKFPGEDSSTGNYKSLGTATLATLYEAYTPINEAKSKQILWVMNNAVLPEDSDSLRDIKLSKIFADLINSTANTENSLTINDIKKYLTEDDLVFAYQCAVWQATNYSTVTSSDNAEILQRVFLGNSTGNNSDWDGLDGNDRWGYRGRKGTYIKEMISYYIDHFNSTENIVPTSTTTNVKPKISKPTQTTYTKSGSKIFVGPFKIESSVTGRPTVDYAVDFIFKDENGNKLNIESGSTGYLLTANTSASALSLLQQTKESLEGNEFYIALPLNTRVRTIDIKLPTSTMVSETTGTVWKATTGTNNQPLLSIDRTETPGEDVEDTYTFEVEVPPQSIDVALRKHVVAVARKNRYDEWSVEYVGSSNGRSPTQTATPDSEFNQYSYNHKKQPIEVKVGDRVIYGITLYNEGETTVRISQITDYLPTYGGLELITSSSDLVYSGTINTHVTKSGNRIIYSNQNQGYIKELEAGDPAVTYLLEFEVTEAAKGKIVTNIAEITEMKDTSGNPLANDDDSAPNNAQLPNSDADWENYNGNDNKDDLDDSNYYYKGYEDDDDFEKITVPLTPINYKYKIVKVDKDTNSKISGATFATVINNSTSNTSITDLPAESSTGEYMGRETAVTHIGIDTLSISELTPPSGYRALSSPIVINVTKTLDGETFKITPTLQGNNENVTMELLDDTIIVTIKNEKIPMDLALRKYITQVNGEDLENSRTPNIDVSTISTQKTAQYKHRKDPVIINTNDEITYNITVYNEGEIKGRPTIIKDQLPTGLEFVSVVGDVFTGSVDSNNLLTLTRKNSNTTNIEAYTSGTPKSETVQIKCKVTAQAGASEKILTNVAWIAEQVNGETGDVITNQQGEDRDSQPATSPNVNKDNMSNYTGKNAETDLSNPNKFYEGQQDDDDFEKVKIEPATGLYNLQIIKVDSSDNTQKLKDAKFTVTMPDSSQTNLTTNTNGEATTPDITITQTGTDTIKIKETEAPTGYDKLIDEIEIEVTKTQSESTYKASSARLKTANNNAQVTINGNTVVVTIKNKKLEGKYNIQIVKVDGKDDTIKLKDAKFTVTMPDSSQTNLTTNTNGEATTPDITITSTGTDTIKIKETDAPMGYDKLIDEIEIEVTKIQSGSTYIASSARLKTANKATVVTLNGNTVVVTIDNQKQLIDLALRKFITQINDSEITDRTPNVDTSTLTDDQEPYTATYKHTKQSKGVKIGDIVTYSLRVYNEGNQDAYASEITEYLPAQLRYLPNNEINQFYMWEMYDSHGNKTNDASKAVKLKTKYGSKENETQEVKAIGERIDVHPNSNSEEKLIYAYDQETMTDGPDYITLKVVCEVVETDEMPEQVTNIAEISKITDMNENEIPRDRDSKPENINYPTDDDLPYYKDDELNKEYVPGQEDDDDFEKIYIARVPGEYDLQIIKVDSQDNTKKLSNAKFTVREQEDRLFRVVGKADNEFTLTTDTNGQAKTPKIAIYSEGEDIFKITETEAPNGYNKLIDIIVVRITKEKRGNSYIVKDVNLISPDDNAQVTLNNGTIVVTIKDEKKKYDLALRKFITKVNNDAVPTRMKSVNTDPLKNGGHDAEYTMDKSVVKVKREDIVTYTIRVFNESEADAYAELIKENIPSGLEYLPNSSINQQYRWHTENGQLVTDYLSKDINPDKQIKAFNKETGEIDYQDVQIELKMVSKSNKIIKNIAEIKEDDGDDPDSKPDGRNNPNKPEDDEDYDNIVPVPFDLALKKFITGVTTPNGDKKIIPEEQQRSLEVVEVSELIERAEYELDDDDIDYKYEADATYRLNKTPVQVAKGDYVTYTIRIFNEGMNEGTATEIVDSIPEGLEFVGYKVNGTQYSSGSRTNFKYGWKMYDAQGNETQDTSKARSIKTTYLKDTSIPAFDETKVNHTYKGLSYADVQVEFKVVTDESNELRNIAEITDDDGEDTDSTPDNEDQDEDDIDYDIVIPGRFDLSLRKFITKIDDKDVTDRIPEVDTKLLDSGESTTATYTHPKDPKVVVKGQIVTYTIRVYNEGTIDGYAEEIKDDLPEGITFLPEHETNKKYGWKMYDENDEETTDVSKAKTIRTSYGSRSNNTGKLLESYDKEEGKGPDYIDVKATFEVTLDSVTASNKVIINTAEVSKDLDRYGNEVEDKDSEPDNDDEKEDDIDKEYLVMKYFDLSLLKYVSKVLVTEDGVTKETETNYNGTENPEPIVKVELNKKKLAKTQVKYVYSIKITNEGEIEGYAKEIKDRIPAGLEFHEEDNKQYNWKVESEGIVTTDYLKDKLLQPGESAVVPITLRWTNSEANLGQKVNVAEISKDENPYGAPDIDSTPDNNKEGEDDQDNAIVLLSLSTGSQATYFILGTTIIVIMAAGIYAIKKYVLD